MYCLSSDYVTAVTVIFQKFMAMKISLQMSLMRRPEILNQNIFVAERRINLCNWSHLVNFLIPVFDFSFISTSPIRYHPMNRFITESQHAKIASRWICQESLALISCILTKKWALSVGRERPAHTVARSSAAGTIRRSLAAGTLRRSSAAGAHRRSSARRRRRRTRRWLPVSTRACPSGACPSGQAWASLPKPSRHASARVLHRLSLQPMFRAAGRRPWKSFSEPQEGLGLPWVACPAQVVPSRTESHLDRRDLLH